MTRWTEIQVNPLAFSVFHKTKLEVDPTVLHVAERSEENSFVGQFNVSISWPEEKGNEGGMYCFEVDRNELVQLAHTILERFRVPRAAGRGVMLRVTGWETLSTELRDSKEDVLEVPAGYLVRKVTTFKEEMVVETRRWVLPENGLFQIEIERESTMKFFLLRIAAYDDAVEVSTDGKRWLCLNRNGGRVRNKGPRTSWERLGEDP